MFLECDVCGSTGDDCNCRPRPTCSCSGRRCGRGEVLMLEDDLRRLRSLTRALLDDVVDAYARGRR